MKLAQRLAMAFRGGGGGGGTWTPAEISGAIVFDALDSDNITLSGSAVTAWKDMMGSGITAAQGSTSLRPAMGTGEVVFAGDYLTIAASNSAAWVKALHSTGGFVFAIAKFGTSANPNAAYGLVGTNRGSTSYIGMGVLYDDRAARPRNNAFVGLIAKGVNGVAPASFAPENVITPNEDRILSVALDPDSSVIADRISYAIDGGVEQKPNAETDSPSTASATYDMDIGATGAGILPLSGSIKCLVFVPSVLLLSDRQKFEGWAAHRHGVASLLPSGHPYKTSAP